MNEKTLIRNAKKYIEEGTKKTIKELKLEIGTNKTNFVKYGNITLMYIENKNFQNSWVLNKIDSRGFYLVIENAKTFNKYFKI